MGHASTCLELCAMLNDVELYLRCSRSQQEDKTLMDAKDRQWTWAKAFGKTPPNIGSE
jgi:hypothetical protein